VTDQGTMNFTDGSVSLEILFLHNVMESCRNRDFKIVVFPFMKKPEFK